MDLKEFTGNGDVNPIRFTRDVEQMMRTRTSSAAVHYRYHYTKTNSTESDADVFFTQIANFGARNTGSSTLETLLEINGGGYLGNVIAQDSGGGAAYHSKLIITIDDNDPVTFQCNDDLDNQGRFVLGDVDYKTDSGGIVAGYGEVGQDGRSVVEVNDAVIMNPYQLLELNKLVLRFDNYLKIEHSGSSASNSNIAAATYILD